MTTIKKTPAHLRTTIIEKRHNVYSEDAELLPYLVIVSGIDQGKQYQLKNNSNIFGRTSDVDIQIEDSKISRKHGAIIIYSDSVVLQDYDSTNGCYINEIRVERQILASNARIRVGSTLMKVEYKNSSEVESENILYEAAHTDNLTKISNRYTFLLRAEEKLSYSKKNNEKLSIIMCDVDHFKKVNDNFGHPAGDYVLVELAKILQTQMRIDDLVARYGGEEFIILLYNGEADDVGNLAERIRKKVEQFSFVFEDKLIPVTLSLGVCSLQGEKIDSLDYLIKNADDALYQAKNKGRNQVQII